MKTSRRADCSLWSIRYEYTRRDHAGFYRSQCRKDGKYQSIILPTMQKMPLIFLGHGSPMNAIETNEYTESWAKLGKKIPRPRAILMLSAHWITS